MVAIAAGADHCLALTAGGEVYSWGSGGNGRLGHGRGRGVGVFRRQHPEFRPRLIRQLEALSIKQASGSAAASCCFLRCPSPVGEGEGRTVCMRVMRVGAAPCIDSAKEAGGPSQPQPHADPALSPCLPPALLAAADSGWADALGVHHAGGPSADVGVQPLLAAGAGGGGGLRPATRGARCAVLCRVMPCCSST